MSELWLRNEGEQSTERVTNKHPLPIALMQTKVPGIESTEIASGTTDVQGVPAMTNLRLLGVSLRESAATAAVATVVLRHGSSTSEPALAIYELDADQSVRDWFGPDGLVCPGGIYVDRVTGTAHLVLYWKAGE